MTFEQKLPSAFRLFDYQWVCAEGSFFSAFSLVSFDIQQPLPNRNYFYSAEIIDDGSLLFVSQYDSLFAW